MKKNRFKRFYKHPLDSPVVVHIYSWIELSLVDMIDILHLKKKKKKFMGWNSSRFKIELFISFHFMSYIFVF